MIKEDLCIKNENADLKRALAGKELSFGSFIVTDLDNKLSVTAKYALKDRGIRYVTLNKDHTTKPVEDKNTAYYGVSPLFDYDEIIDLISRRQLKSLGDLDGYIEEHADMFMLHEEQAGYLWDFARYIVLAVVSIFSIRLKLSPDEAVQITSLDDYCKETAEWDDKTGVLTIHGCPTEKIDDVLSSFRFCKGKGKDKIFISDPDGDLTISEIYGKTENITLTNGTVFYSGTLIKPTEIICPENRYEDNHVKSVIIEFEKTTYATVFSLDNDFTGHPLLKDCRKHLVSLLRQDDCEKDKLIDKLEAQGLEPKERLRAVNEYLSKCINPNQIGVTGNILTKDNVLIMGHRGSNTIDSGSLYPGVNGNAEIADPNVAFYKKSMYEDYPTVYLENHRIDFLGEISRETYAELKLELKREEWECCGIVLSGSRPPEDSGDEEYGCKRRRLHFNIIFQQSVDKTFWEIEQSSKKATENFESNYFIGLRVRCYKNQLNAFIEKTISLFKMISEQNDTLESVLLLLMFGVAFFTKQAFSDALWYTILTMVLAIIIVFSAAFDAVEFFKHLGHKLKRSKEIRIYQRMSFNEANDKILKGLEGYSYHPATFAALKLFVDNQILNKLLDEDEARK